MDHQFVVYTQNHDQTGNRALGERLGHLVPMARARVAAALLLTAPFTPMLFQGEEWAARSPFQYFTDHDDPALGEVRRGRRAAYSAWGADPEVVPDPQAPETFQRSCLDWSELPEAAHAGMLRWYRHLIQLRRTYPALGSGKAPALVDLDEVSGLLRVQRGRFTVLANLGAGDLPVRVAADCAVLAASDGAICPVGRTLTLPPDSVLILDRNPSPAPADLPQGSVENELRTQGVQGAAEQS